MCPFCISAAALAWAGTGSAGGLAAMVAVKLHLKPQSEKGPVERGAAPTLNLHPPKAGGGK